GAGLSQGPWAGGRESRAANTAAPATIPNPGQTPGLSRARAWTGSVAASDIDLAPTLNPGGARHACHLVTTFRRFSFVLALASTRLWRRLPLVLRAPLGVAPRAPALHPHPPRGW